jgi:hypothetical protein
MDRRMAGYGWEDGRISEDDRIWMVGWHNMDRKMAEHQRWQTDG